MKIRSCATELRDMDAEALFLTRYRLAELEELAARTKSRRHPLLPICHEGALVLIGPVQGPQGGVCLACAETQRLAAFGTAVPVGDPRLTLRGVASPAFQPALLELAATMLADAEQHADVVYALRTDHGSMTRHTVMPRTEGCPTCAPRPTEEPIAQPSPPAATAVAQTSSPTAESAARAPLPAVAGTLRTHNPRTEGSRLHDTLIDSRYGPVAGLRRSGSLALPTVAAMLAGDPDGQVAGFGRTGDFAQSERVALFEAVERLSGMRPHGGLAGAAGTGGAGRVARAGGAGGAVWAAFADLGPDRAVDPATLGLHEPDRYRTDPHRTLVPYAPDVPTTWAQGWSFTRSTPLLVPEHVAYWGLPRSDAARFVAETSSGCGLGNSLAEAVLHGFFEVAERDAFLMAWYAGTPLPRLAVPDDHPLLPHLVDRLDHRGYVLEFLDATNDLGVPVALAMARQRDGRQPAAFFAAGAHPDPVAAMVSAAAEIAVDVESAADRARRAPGDYTRERLLRLLDDPDRIRTMEDHVAVYGLPEAAGKYAFLLGDAPEPVPAPAPPGGDLWAVLDHYVGHLRGLGLELAAVDQSHPVIRDRLGLRAAKVIVPGTLPMTFGHANRRLRGLDRLWSVPALLGRRSTRGPDRLPPHPFP
ncbi:TOMM precursor leader peptide-binding protein [Nonomuraea wenchangensis]